MFKANAPRHKHQPASFGMGAGFGAASPANKGFLLGFALWPLLLLGLVSGDAPGGVQLIVEHPHDGAVLHAPEVLWLNLQLSIADAERVGRLSGAVFVCLLQQPQHPPPGAGDARCTPLPVPLSVDEAAQRVRFNSLQLHTDGLGQGSHLLRMWLAQGATGAGAADTVAANTTALGAAVSVRVNVRAAALRLVMRSPQPGDEVDADDVPVTVALEVVDSQSRQPLPAAWVAAAGWGLGHDTAGHVCVEVLGVGGELSEGAVGRLRPPFCAALRDLSDLLLPHQGGGGGGVGGVGGGGIAASRVGGVAGAGAQGGGVRGLSLGGLVPGASAAVRVWLLGTGLPVIAARGAVDYAAEVAVRVRRRGAGRGERAEQGRVPYAGLGAVCEQEAEVEGGRPAAFGATEGGGAAATAAAAAAVAAAAVAAAAAAAASKAAAAAAASRVEAPTALTEALEVALNSIRPPSTASCIAAAAAATAAAVAAATAAAAAASPSLNEVARECARLVVLNMTDKNLMHWLLPWVRQLRRLGFARSYIVVAMDGETMAFCREHGLVCVRWREATAEGEAAAAQEGGGANPHTAKVRADVGRVKFAATLALLQLGRSVIFSEMDVVWLRDPIPGFGWRSATAPGGGALEAAAAAAAAVGSGGEGGEEQACNERWCGLMAGALSPWRCGGAGGRSCDLLMTAHSEHSRVNIGFFFAAPTARARSFLRRLLRLHRRSMFDQTEFDLLLGDNVDTAEGHGSNEWRFLRRDAERGGGACGHGAGGAAFAGALGSNRSSSGGGGGSSSSVGGGGVGADADDSGGAILWRRLPYNVFAGGDGVERYDQMLTLHTFKPMLKEALQKLYEVADGGSDAIPAPGEEGGGDATNALARAVQHSWDMTVGQCALEANSTLPELTAGSLPRLLAPQPTGAAPFAFAFARPGFYRILTPPTAPALGADVAMTALMRERVRLQQTEPSTLTAYSQHMTLQMQVDVGALPELGWRGGAARCAAEHTAAAAAADMAAGSSNATASHQQRQHQPAGEDEIVAQSMVCFRGGLVGGGADSPYTVSMCMPSCPDRDQMLRAPAGRLGLPAYEVRAPPSLPPAAPVHSADTATPLLARTSRSDRSALATTCSTCGCSCRASSRVPSPLTRCSPIPCQCASWQSKAELSRTSGRYT
jgi:hypothetical protein